MKKLLIAVAVAGLIALYALGALDVWLIENGVLLNLYDCQVNRLTGEAVCSGPLSP